MNCLRKGRLLLDQGYPPNPGKRQKDREMEIEGELRGCKKRERD